MGCVFSPSTLSGVSFFIERTTFGSCLLTLCLSHLLSLICLPVAFLLAFRLPFLSSLLFSPRFFFPDRCSFFCCCHFARCFFHFLSYVALSMLCKVVQRDTQAIQRHRNTIVDCLKDADISIRRRALDLICALVNNQNVKGLVGELLKYLQMATLTADNEFKADLTEKICDVIFKFAPSTRWQIDTALRVLECVCRFIFYLLFRELCSCHCALRCWILSFRLVRMRLLLFPVIWLC